MEINIGQQTEYAGYKPQIAIGLDKTLTKQGYAAEAKAVGLALQQNRLHTYSEEELPQPGLYNASINAHNIGINGSDLDVYAGEISLGSENNALLILDSGAPKTDIFGWNLNIGSEEGVHTTSPSVDFSAKVDGSIQGFGGISFDGYEQEEDVIIKSTTVDSTAHTTTLNFHHTDDDTPASRLAVNVDGSLNVSSGSLYVSSYNYTNSSRGDLGLSCDGRFTLVSGGNECFLTMGEEGGNYTTAIDTPFFRVQAYESADIYSSDTAVISATSELRLRGYPITIELNSVVLDDEQHQGIQNFSVELPHFPSNEDLQERSYTLKYHTNSSSQVGTLGWVESPQSISPQLYQHHIHHYATAGDLGFDLYYTVICDQSTAFSRWAQMESVLTDINHLGTDSGLVCASGLVTRDGNTTPIYAIQNSFGPGQVTVFLTDATSESFTPNYQTITEQFDDAVSFTTSHIA